ncbi:MAG: ribonuclease E/G [Actinomycetota bacterium]
MEDNDKIGTAVGSTAEPRATEHAAPAPQARTEADTPPSGGASQAPNGGPDGTTEGTGAPKKRRRRGKRGGKRHKKKAPGTAANQAAATDDGDETGDAAPAQRPRQPRQQQRSRPQQQRAPQGEEEGETPPRPRPARAAAAAEPSDAEAADGVDVEDEGSADAGSATGAKRKRRRRRRKPAAAGGNGAGGATSTARQAGEKQPSAEKQPEKQPEKQERQPQQQGSTRLAARALRQQKQARTRRPRRRLTEEEAQQLRGGAKTMLVHVHDDRTQIAVVEEGVLIEHYVARKGRTTFAGNIYLGRVQNVLPGMEAAFVDFGRGRNGVLYAGEVNYSAEDLEGPAGPRIEKVLRSGQAVLVQVTKDPIGTKGARLTSQVSLAGRYLVLAPEQQLSGISRRLAEVERNRLRQILREIAPKEHGVIVRTAAEGASRDAIERDLQTLLKAWNDVQTKRKKAKAPAPLYEEPELIMKVVRDIFSGDFERVVVDARAEYEEIKAYLEETAPDLLEKLELHSGPLPLFETHRVSEQLHKALERKVWLPSGGSLVIDRTEAMTVIDVNTGKFTGKGSSLEETVFHNNVEAAEEIARQLRLRDIGGIIMIDFVDMIDPKNQVETLRTLKRGLSRDKTRSQVFDFSNLGVVEMTRKRVSEGLLDAFSEPCPNCQGRGIVITHEID